MTERPNTLSGLIEKRRELAGKIEYHQNQLSQLENDLGHIEACIRLFDPGADLAGVRPKPFPPRQTGMVSIYIMETLRDAKRPLSTREIAVAVMQRRGMDTTYSKAVSRMANRTGRQLRDLRRKGRVRSELGAKRETLWRL